MSFAAAESRANASMMARLANATAQVAGGEAFPVIFDAAYAVALGGQIGATGPQAMALDTDLQAVDVGIDTAIIISKLATETDYKVREMQPDGAGATVLILERA